VRRERVVEGGKRTYENGEETDGEMTSDEVEERFHEVVCVKHIISSRMGGTVGEGEPYLFIALTPSTKTALGTVCPASTMTGMTTACFVGSAHPFERSKVSARPPKSSISTGSRFMQASSNGHVHCGVEAEEAERMEGKREVEDDDVEGAGEPAFAAPGEREPESRRSRKSRAVVVLPVPVDVDAEEERETEGVMSTRASLIMKGWSSGIPDDPRSFSLMTERVERS
jgi:hypothetical protein